MATTSASFRQHPTCRQALARQHCTGASTRICCAASSQQGASTRLRSLWALRTRLLNTLPHRSWAAARTKHTPRASTHQPLRASTRPKPATTTAPSQQPPAAPCQHPPQAAPCQHPPAAPSQHPPKEDPPAAPSQHPPAAPSQHPLAAPSPAPTGRPKPSTHLAQLLVGHDEGAADVAVLHQPLPVRQAQLGAAGGQVARWQVAGGQVAGGQVAGRGALQRF